MRVNHVVAACFPIGSTRCLQRRANGIAVLRARGRIRSPLLQIAILLINGSKPMPSQGNQGASRKRPTCRVHLRDGGFRKILVGYLALEVLAIQRELHIVSAGAVNGWDKTDSMGAIHREKRHQNDHLFVVDSVKAAAGLVSLPSCVVRHASQRIKAVSKYGHVDTSLDGAAGWSYVVKLCVAEGKHTGRQAHRKFGKSETRKIQPRRNPRG